jgi:signal transduction histidine kinase
MESENDKNLVYAQKACASIDRLNDLINELLDVSKLQYGKLGLKITVMYFNEMVSEAIEEVQFGSPSHRIIKEGSIPQQVTGDKERLKQVVINMLTNAVKYSPGADTVYVDICSEAGSVKLSVRDTGIGIQKENLEKIFERYYREEERDVRFQGLGIGLFISHEIILRHKGKIWAESEPGIGSTFYFKVPIKSRFGKLEIEEFGTKKEIEDLVI